MGKNVNMTDWNENTAKQVTQSHSWRKSSVYRENVEFWEHAWNMVKTPYTQMPELPYLTSISDRLKKAGARNVLDLGCGSGWLSIFLARHGFFVTGIDIAHHAIELAKLWAMKENLEVKFDLGDIADLPYAAGTFDAIVANSVFEHLPYELAAAVISKLKYILIPGGTFFGCFDKVGGGPGEYYELSDKTHVYTDKARRGMLLRYFNDDELRKLFANFTLDMFEVLTNGSRIIWAHT